MNSIEDRLRKSLEELEKRTRIHSDDDADDMKRNLRLANSIARKALKEPQK